MEVPTCLKQIMQNFFYLLLTISFIACNNGPKMEELKKLPTFDWQGHRGARGLVPENTVPAFLKALEFNIRTLEMDAAISQDAKVIISHEPWFSMKYPATQKAMPLAMNPKRII